MKKIIMGSLATLLAGSVVAHAAPTVKVYGDINALYRSTTMSGATEGKYSGFTYNAVALKVDVDVNDKVAAHLKLDLDHNDPALDDIPAEEAWLSYKLSDTASIQIGKDEMPFVQDKRGLLEDGYVHSFEIDKVLGLVYTQKIGSMLKLNVASFEADDLAVGDNEADTGLGQSYLLKLTANPTAKVQFQLALANEHNDLATGATTKDSSYLNIAGKIKDLGPATVYYEYVSKDAKPETGDSIKSNAMQLGVEVKLNNKCSITLEIGTNEPNSDADDDEATEIGLKYQHQTSAATKVYAGITNQTEKTAGDDQKTNIFGFGAAIKF